MKKISLLGIGIISIFLWNTLTNIAEAIVTVCASGCNYTSIQQGLNSSGEVLVGDGTYYERILIKRGMGARILRSLNGPNSTIINGRNLGDVITIEPTNDGTVIDGFTITGGGTGISSSSGVTIKNNKITGNNGGAGGGIYIGSGPAEIVNNIISGNYASNGGGIRIYGGFSNIINNIISQNYSGNYGGGLWVNGNNNYISKNIIYGNTAGYAAGAVYVVGYAYISNSIIFKNSSPNGVIYIMNNNRLLNIVNTTITENSTGIRLGSYSNIYMYNSILWNNGPTETNGGTISYSIVKGGYPGTGNINADPLFVNPLADNYRLSYNSPAIDTGMNTSASTYGSVVDDIDGTLRPYDGDNKGSGTTGDGSDYDIGAYERYCK